MTVRHTWPGDAKDVGIAKERPKSDKKNPH